MSPNNLLFIPATPRDFWYPPTGNPTGVCKEKVKENRKVHSLPRQKGDIHSLTRGKSALL